MLTLLCSVMSWAEEATLSTMATSGTIVEDIITFSTAANGSNNPQISSSQLRLYANTSADMSTGEKGGSITFTAAEGYVINQVTLAIANDGNSNTTAGYQVDGTGSWIGSENNVVKNTNYSTGDNLGARTVEIANFGTTTKSNRIYITSITVKYTAVAKEKYTVTLGDDNSTLVQANISEAVKLPSRSDIGDYKFAGWSTTNVTEETTTAPAIIKSGDYVPKANITLYPVYSKDEGIPNQTVSVNVAEYAAAHNWTVLASGSATKDTHCKYEIDINDDVKVTTNDNNVNGAVYADGWRIYQSYNGTVNVTTTAGSLVSVKFTYTNGNSGQLFYDEDQLTSNTAIDVEGTSAEFKVIRPNSTTTNGQVKITDIEVTYGGGVTYYTSVPVAPTPAAKTIDFYAAGEDGYYVTFSNDKAVTIPDMIEVDGEYAEFTVYSVYAVGNLLELKDVYKTPDTDTWYLSENEGYLIKAEFTGDIEFTGSKAFSVEYTELDYNLNGHDADNFLRPASEAKTGDKKFYMLAYSDDNYTPASLGFYWGEDDGAAFESRANSAYLALPATQALAKGFRFVDSNATAIKNVENKVKTNAVYNLAGQLVSTKGYKGIVIKNGKKVLNK